MSKQTRYEFPDERTVAIKQDGRTVTGRYRTHSGMIIVRAEYGSKTMQTSGSTDDALRVLARSMLRDLLNEGMA